LLEVFLSKGTHFSQRNSMLHAEASKNLVFFGLLYESSTQLNRPIRSKENLFPPFNTVLAGSFLFQS
jgi:hypothetical protein